jgi:hypothetical protein
MFGPNGPHLLVSRKFAASRCRFGGGNRRPLRIGEGYGRGVPAAGQLKHNACDIVLRVRWEVARGFEGLIEEFGHIGKILLFVRLTRGRG